MFGFIKNVSAKLFAPRASRSSHGSMHNSRRLISQLAHALHELEAMDVELSVLHPGTDDRHLNPVQWDAMVEARALIELLLQAGFKVILRTSATHTAMWVDCQTSGFRECVYASGVCKDTVYESTSRPLQPLRA